MSRAVLSAILAEMGIWLNATETEQLHNELLAYFGLIGATNECQTLEISLKLGRDRPLLADYLYALKSRTENLSRYKAARLV